MKQPTIPRNPAALLASNAGTDLRTVARHWPVRRTKAEGLTEKKLRGRVRRIQRATLHGGLAHASACKLARLLNCPTKIFLAGYAAYMESHEVMKGGAEAHREGIAGRDSLTTAKAVTAGRSGCRPRVQFKAAVTAEA